mgnify:CR=1 FL=1|tara:strand:+ start:61 stop:1389 length:1329 start_codon:yes stop_codon:yes gene_type:complete
MSTEVGYKKNIKFIERERDEGGPVNKNEVVDIVEKYYNAAIGQEFYEIEPAIVERVFLDTDEPDFPTITNDKGETIKDYGAIGSIQVTRLYSKPIETISTPIKPLSPHIVQLPLRGEMVNIANYDGVLYYSNPINLNNQISSNNSGAGSDVVILDLLKYNRKIKAQPGDTVIQGRYGQSIHFGSDINNVKPNIKIGVGQGFNESLNAKKAANSDYPHEENINNEEAAIWITTAEHVPLKTASPSKDKTAKSNGKGDTALHSLITLNADSLILNSKESKISLFAHTNFNVSALKEINLETPAGKIKLLEPDADDPIVKGKDLTKFLKKMLTTFKKHNNKLNSMVKSLNPNNEDFVKALNQQRTQLSNDITDLKDELKFNGSKNIYPKFCSKRVFVGVDKAVDDDLDDLELERMWDTAVWNEIESVTNVNYEVEKVTSTAGVRG